MSDISKYKTYLGDYLKRFHNINNPKKFFHCLNPNHIDNNPSMMYTDKYNICKCFSCGAYYDIFDLIGMDFKVDSFKDRIDKLKEIYFDYVPVSNEKVSEKKLFYDYNWYYNKCIKDIDNTDYLLKRGITKDLIKKYKIGYDSERKLIIFPINRYCYFARSTINNDKLKSKGNSDIWNKDLLNDSNDIIYVTEGIIDSLSLEVIDPNVKTISINGVGNINSLVYAVKNSNFNGAIVIAFDNDLAGINASKKLKEELSKINVSAFTTSLISNFDNENCKDINNALLINRELLEKNYHYFDDNYKRVVGLINENDLEM